MRLDRGRTGFRYRCAMPDCAAYVDVWSDEPHKHPNTYTPPAPWHTEYGGVWCEAHWPAVEAYRASMQAWDALQHAHRKPLYLVLERQCAEWETTNPRPVPPWKKETR